MLSFSQLSIVIPAFNEAASIEQTLDALVSHPRLHGAEIILVDDGSTDLTAEIAQCFRDIRVISHCVNRGYGSALVTSYGLFERGA